MFKLLRNNIKEIYKKYWNVYVNLNNESFLYSKAFQIITISQLECQIIKKKLYYNKSYKKNLFNMI